ncbi:MULTISPECIES: helix-turn-helix transcriptional regulator [unclassified Micromonospora]|uniref:PadR family transcriptional regulator n=1 Tax=Micromonospora TaxID=1873 RepID=UPI002416211C|nr:MULTISPECIES: helix-turn-helix transcriptional regulator [unclassified Micromonospora]MDG4816900.1 helix-turn-helix transcriptional regulator [Micromonospora sp. WMMD956]WFE59391.1 helix-turn-helix transcriptional regulator [Micromonospora sp. WMMD712]
MSHGPTRVTQPLLDVLEVLLVAEDHDLHGWAIMKATRRSGPTIYKILERLAASEWVEGRWEVLRSDESRPRRRFYRLTPLGVVEARSLLASRRPRPSNAYPRPAFGCQA